VEIYRGGGGGGGRKKSRPWHGESLKMKILDNSIQLLGFSWTLQINGRRQELVIWRTFWLARHSFFLPCLNLEHHAPTFIKITFPSIVTTGTCCVFSITDVATLYLATN